MSKLNLDALHRLDTFPQAGQGKSRHVLSREIFSEYQGSTKDMIEGLRALAAYRRGDLGFIEAIDVDPTTLKPTQTGIFRHKLKKDLKKRNFDKPVIVWQRRAEKFLLDGHHKVATALLTGDPVVRAIVIDLDKIAKELKEAKMVTEEKK